MQHTNGYCLFVKQVEQQANKKKPQKQSHGRYIPGTGEIVQCRYTHSQN